MARSLLGSVLECDTGHGRASGRIVETEAYLGPDDAASHAASGLSARTQHLFGPPGTSYVYFVYGMHWCFNAVTERRGGGTAVLVRGLEPVDGIALMRARRARHGSSLEKGDSIGEGLDRRDRQLTNGPGKLCAALGIDGDLSGVWLQRPPLMLRRGSDVSDSEVVVSPRIGITKATSPRERYFIRDNPFVSRTPGDFPIAPFKRSRG